MCRKRCRTLTTLISGKWKSKPQRWLPHYQNYKTNVGQNTSALVRMQNGAGAVQMMWQRTKNGILAGSKGSQSGCIFVRTANQVSRRHLHTLVHSCIMHRRQEAEQATGPSTNEQLIHGGLSVPYSALKSHAEPRVLSVLSDSVFGYLASVRHRVNCYIKGFFKFVHF